MVLMGEEAIKMEADIEKTVERVTRKFLQDEFQFTVQKSISNVLKQAGLIKSTDIILSGDLANFTFTDIIHILTLRGMGVKLSIFSEALSADLYLNKNNILYASTKRQGTQTAPTNIGGNQTDVSPSLSGDFSMASKSSIYDDICAIMELETGSFTVEKIYPADKDLFSNQPDINLSDAIVEASRRVNERVFAPLFDGSTKFIKVVPDNVLKNYNFNKNELLLFACVDGERSLNDIIDITNIEVAAGKRSFFVLLNAGLIKIL